MTMKNKSHKKKVISGLSDQTKYWSGETEYKLGFDHPHRQLILDALKKIEFKNVLEIGCNIGQNLYRIGLEYPKTQLAGVDVNKRAIQEARVLLPEAILCVDDATNLVASDRTYDVLLYDAVLMYVKDIDKALDEAIRVARKVIIILDFDTKRERLVGHTMVRDYGRLLALKGLRVKSTKIKTWDSPKWKKYGRLYVAQVQ